MPTNSTTAKADRAAGKLRILIVEDEVFVAMDTEAMLSAAGHLVVGSAVSADEAIKISDEQRPDLVLMDIRLASGRDGIDAAQEIKARSCIPIIFVTAHNDGSTRERAAKVKPVAFVAKPIDPQQLLSAINRVSQL